MVANDVIGSFCILIILISLVANDITRNIYILQSASLSVSSFHDDGRNCFVLLDIDMIEDGT